MKVQPSFNHQSFKSDKVSSQKGLEIRSHESPQRPSDLASLPKYEKYGSGKSKAHSVRLVESSGPEEALGAGVRVEWLLLCS